MTPSTATKTEAEKQKYCSGCRDDFYNHRDSPGFDGSTKCWSLKDAEVVKRYRIHWWTRPASAKAFQKVTTLSCHNAPGRYAHYKELPEHCR
jgi:hypothetical protein